MESLAPSPGICRGCAAVRIAVRRRIGSAVRRTASREQTYDQSDDPSRRTKFACVHLVLALRSYCAKNRSAHPENISECAENMFCYVRLIIVRFYRTAILPSHFRHYFRFPPHSALSALFHRRSRRRLYLVRLLVAAQSQLCNHRHRNGKVGAWAASIAGRMPTISPTTSTTDGSVPPNSTGRPSCGTIIIREASRRRLPTQRNDVPVSQSFRRGRGHQHAHAMVFRRPRLHGAHRGTHRHWAWRFRASTCRRFRLDSQALSGVDAVVGNAVISTRWLDAVGNLAKAVEMTARFVGNVADRDNEGFDYLKVL